MADLWSVVIGGALAVGGSAATQWYLHTAKAADDRRKLREQRLEELISLVYEHAHWMENLRAINVFGKDERQTISPISKLNAIAAIHFPEFLPAIKKLDLAAGKYQRWMFAKGKERLNGNFDELGDGFEEAYEPYLSASSQLLDEMQTFSERA
ncbi:MAG: hypothetical protein JSS54_16390 [Proteobacteria bacterium]|nr:hypothetical protein [Pseudomonadota bacterium]